MVNIKERYGHHDNEMEALDIFIGDKITCIYFENGILKGIRGILDSVIAYDFISIEGEKIKFIGERQAIKYIIFHEVILYQNDIEYYKGTKNEYLLKLLQYKYLGYSILYEQHKRKVYSNHHKLN